MVSCTECSPSPGYRTTGRTGILFFRLTVAVAVLTIMLSLSRVHLSIPFRSENVHVPDTSTAVQLDTWIHRKLKTRRMEGASVDAAVDVVPPNRYIVILKDSVLNVTQTAQELVARAHCGRLAFVYQVTIKGFAVHDCPNEHLQDLLEHDDVQHAWEDEQVSGDLNFNANTNGDAMPPPVAKQSTADFEGYWLDHLDQRSPPYDNQYRYNWDGTNVTIFIFDTGIRLNHQEFKSSSSSGGHIRTVECGFNALENDGEPSCDDNHGHGTFTAALAAGITYGAAKQANIVAVRVLDRNKLGTVAGILAGLEYVAQRKRDNPKEPMVINMSLSTTPRGIILGCLLQFTKRGRLFGCLWEGRQENKAWMDAIDSIVASGVVVVVSAGNTLMPRVSACLSTPGRSNQVITVGGSTARNTQWIFSRTGLCVDISAPAQSITSAWVGGSLDVDTTSIQSGTSASAPIVAGVAALYLQRDSTLTPTNVKQAMLDDSVRGLKWKSLLTPNRLVSTVGLLEG